MCGVAAVFAYRPESGRVDRDEIRRVRDRMAPRGPDGVGEWFSDDGRVALAHRRLSIIDLSARGAQPMRDASGMRVVVFNGEIYNYRELRAQLRRRGYEFTSESDTEVLLHLYADRGAAMVHDLRGMFALAIWDEARRGLFLARDPFGIKPLYWSDDGRRFRAASEVKALLAGGGIVTSPEPAGHVGYFLWGHVPEPYTLYRGVRALPAGCTMWVGAEGAEDARVYASPTTMLAGETVADAGGAEEAFAENGDDATLAADPAFARERLRAALLDSVRHHLIADVDVGVFLSAGLDSIAIAALAAQAGTRLRTVTLGFDEYRGTSLDETPIAESVARRLGADHRTVWIGRDEFRREVPRILDRMDQPTTDGVNAYFVARAAAQTGLKVALSGLGGDELFGGYPSFTEIPRAVSALRFVPGVSRIGRAFRVVSAGVLGRRTSPKYAGIFEYGADYGGAYLLRRGMFMPWELAALLDPEMVREGWAELRTRALLQETGAGLPDGRSKVSALEATWYMRNQLLRDTDWASMSHSLEVRVPLVDRVLWTELAPLFRALPELGKRDMAAAAWAGMPDEVSQRPKTGFSIPVREWMLEDSGNGTRARGLRGWARYVHEAAA